MEAWGKARNCYWQFYDGRDLMPIYVVVSFIKGADETITEWLGGGNSIAIDWKLSEKLILGIDTKITPKEQRTKYISRFYHLHESIQPIGKTIVPNPYAIESTGDKDKILEFSIKHFSKRKRLCWFMLWKRHCK